MAGQQSHDAHILCYSRVTFAFVGEQAFLPLLGTDTSLQGKPGRVLNMSSIYGSYALPFSVRCYVPSMFGQSLGYAVS